MDTKDTLQDCLEHLERGETLDQVLARHPEQSAELALLLALTQGLHRAAPKMSESAKARVRYQVYGAARTQRPTRVVPLWQTWALRIAITLIAVLMLGGRTLVAAESAPGGSLFPARAMFNETRVRLAVNPRAMIRLHLENAEERMADVHVLRQRGRLHEENIFLMVGEMENLMVALENSPGQADRATLERAAKLARAERALLRDLIRSAPVERARRNAETLYQLSATWEPLLNRLLGK